MPDTIHFNLTNNQMTDVNVNVFDDRTNKQVLDTVPLNQNESVAVEVGKLGVRQNEIRGGNFDLAEGVETILGGGDAVAGLLQADLEDSHTARVSIHEKKLLLRQGFSL